MIYAKEMRPGMVILFEGDLLRVIDCHLLHTRDSRLWFVQAKLRNLKSGNTFEHRFGADEKVERSIIH